MALLYDVPNVLAHFGITEHLFSVSPRAAMRSLVSKHTVTEVPPAPCTYPSGILNQGSGTP